MEVYCSVDDWGILSYDLDYGHKSWLYYNLRGLNIKIATYKNGFKEWADVYVDFSFKIPSWTALLYFQNIN